MVETNLNLGQHFMIDENLLDVIVALAKIENEDRVLEIGSGNGALTKKLIGLTKQLICVEKDSSFNDILTNLLSSKQALSSESTILPKPTFYNENILDIIEDLDFNKIVANIPYHISEPLMKKILKKEPSLIVMVTGKQFAEKLQEESIIGIITREKYSLKLEKIISPESFNPPPKVYSALIVLERKNNFGLLHDFFEFSKSKVKNYVLKKLENTLTKKEAKNFLKEKLSFSEKKLYSLNVKEVIELRLILQDILKN